MFLTCRGLDYLPALSEIMPARFLSLENHPGDIVKPAAHTPFRRDVSHHFFLRYRLSVCLDT